ncbi:MAG: DUF2235 domain-containing protein [Pirellulaceae bacterium]|nr:DUF2235 domain-containing protein [Pirellulaceae bacterium]
MSKNIVICCDGTGSDVICDSTNVLRLFRSLLRSEHQTVYYDSGVGTVSDPSNLTWFGKSISRKLDGAIGRSVRENVCRAYQFLVRTYQSGDRVYLFGFSRGAYTVRALAGMIHFLGLVQPELTGLDRLAWTIYADDHHNLPISKRFEAGNRFKRSFSRAEPVRIHFMGVWETVSAFGWIWQLRSVPFTANNPSIDHVRHAVAIDEHRTAFQPNLFRPSSVDQHMSFQELWFAGSHGDVGGGYPEAENGLAKITLQWMFEEAAGQGCLFDHRQVEDFLGVHGRRSGPDVMAPAHASTVGLWRLMEYVPRRHWDHYSVPERMRWFAPNLYRPRRMPPDAVMHSSVREKIDRDVHYRPRQSLSQ